MKKYLYSFFIFALCATCFTNCKDKEETLTYQGVTIPTSLYLSVPQSKTLVTTILSGTVSKSVIWSSDKPEIATVDNAGNVTAVRPGRAIITVKTQDGNHFNTCAVDVRGIPIPETLTLGEGENKTYAPIFGDLSDKKYRKTVVTSGDKSVATIDTTGKITAVAEGTVTITTTLTDKYATYETSCKVTVVPAVTAFTLTTNYFSLGMIEGSYKNITLPYTVAPEGSAITWSSSNKGVVTVDNTGAITAVGLGFATVTGVSVLNSKTVTCTVEVISYKMTRTVLDKYLAALKLLPISASTTTIKPTVISNYQDEKTVTWSSSDTSIATVDDAGKVIAVAVGTATITATPVAIGGKPASCVVTVAAL